jgi:hypothetical protein
MTRFGRSITAAHVEHQSAHAAAQSDFTTHAIGPKTVELAIFECFGGRKPEGNVGTGSTRNRHDLYLVFFRIDARAYQHSA